ncbi:MAG TPA: hypothetical protein ENI73_03125 [Spirochaetes bacterium]|nr:hypothetical protein [Spirochaetota bacterium]
MKTISKKIILWIITTIFLIMTYAYPIGKKDSRSFTFDKFRLGDNYGKIMNRKPYNEPCDNDPVDKNKRREMVYGALPCRERTFPKKTTVIFYLKYSEKEKYTQPIEAFAYLYGSYFDDKTDFPLKPNDSLEDAKKEFNQPIKSFMLKRKRSILTVHKFKGNIFVVSKEKKIIGFVIGPMPSDPQNEQWRGLMQMYDRYTPHK